MLAFGGPVPDPALTADPQGVPQRVVRLAPVQPRNSHQRDSGPVSGAARASAVDSGGFRACGSVRRRSGGKKGCVAGLPWGGSVGRSGAPGRPAPRRRPSGRSGDGQGHRRVPVGQGRVEGPPVGDREAGKALPGSLPEVPRPPPRPGAAADTLREAAPVRAVGNAGVTVMAGTVVRWRFPCPKPVPERWPWFPSVPGSRSLSASGSGRRAWPARGGRRPREGR